MKYPKKCPWCGSKLLIKDGKYGIFLGCIKFPRCRYTFDLQQLVLCPECGKRMVIKDGTRGMFLGCTGYPECYYTINLKKKELTQIHCSNCGDFMVVREGQNGFFLGCNKFPSCRHTLELRRSYEKFDNKKLKFENYKLESHITSKGKKSITLITTESIKKIISVNWKNFTQINNELRLVDNIDIRFLKIKLKNLERKGELISKDIQNDKFWKVMNSQKN